MASRVVCWRARVLRVAAVWSPRSKACRAWARVVSWADAVSVMGRGGVNGAGRKGKANCGKIAG